MPKNDISDCFFVRRKQPFFLFVGYKPVKLVEK